MAKTLKKIISEDPLTIERLAVLLDQLKNRVVILEDRLMCHLEDENGH